MLLRLLRILVMVLLAGQAVVAQAHVHAPRQIAAERPIARAVPEPVLTHARAECLLCRVAARDDACPPAKARPVAAAPSAGLSPRPSPAVVAAPARRAAPWRSRAPPSPALA